jgi:polyhydroxyalkanoate synthesis regulator phasin
MTKRRILPLAALVSSLCLAGHAAGADAVVDDRKGLTELRNTVVNLLQGLVERGVLTRDQAEKMVKDAQTKATADANATVQREKDEAGAVRVPYVPQIVKDEIRRQVAADLSAEVTKNVIDAGQAEGWATPGALPDWARRVRLYGDVRVRGQGDFFAPDNVANSYIDFQTVNEKGGIGKTGLAAFVNTTEDRQRLRARLRLGLEANLGYGWALATRLATGNLRDSVSSNQTLGTTAARYQIGVDLAYIQWAGASGTGRHALDVSAGRIRNPWQSTDLVWDQDLGFEGVAGTYRLGLSRADFNSHYAFLTAGVFPVQEVELASDKWLLGGQFGFDWKFYSESRLRIAAAYYDYRNTAGRRNSFESNLLDFTAPQWLQRGNTLYDIRNDNDPNTNLFALAADYRLADITATYDWKVSPGYKLTLTADYVRNVGYDEAAVQLRTGFAVPRRNEGYQAEVAFGSSVMAARDAWRVYLGYRSLQRDAVLDAFTDSDFRLGGTDVKGYFIGGEYAISPRVNARLRYMSGNAIDGPPLGIDVLQVDLNASF